MSELVDRRRRRTKHDVVEAAIPLFIDRGFEATSMADVARAAGVSRRTLYRLFETKDDIVYELPEQWFEVFTAALGERAHAESTRELYRRAQVEVARHVQSDAAAVLAAFSVVLATPSLRVRHARSDARWAEEVASLIAADVADPLAAAVAASALVGAMNAVIATWAATQPNGRLVAMTVSALDQLDSIWPGACRSDAR